VRHVSRTVDPTGAVSLEIVGANIRNDTNNRAPGFVVQESNMLPHGVLIRPKPARGFRGYHCHGSPRDIGIAEPSARQKRDAHHAKVTGSHDVEPEKGGGVT